MSKDTVEVQNKFVDQKTGKVVTVKLGTGGLVPPSRKSISPIDKVAGKNPPVFSLKDHPEWAGMELIVVDVNFASGTIGDKSTEYMIADTYIVAPGADPKPENYVLLRSGADNVYQRVVAAYAAGAMPVSGILRLAGRKWLLD